MAILQRFSGEYGFVISIPTGRDLTTSTAFRLCIKNPQGVKTNKTLTNADIALPITTGIISYTAQTGDFAVPGTYQLQIFDETSPVNVASPVLKIKVRPAIDYTEV